VACETSVVKEIYDLCHVCNIYYFELYYNCFVCILFVGWWVVKENHMQILLKDLPLHCSALKICSRDVNQIYCHRNTVFWFVTLLLTFCLLWSLLLLLDTAWTN